MGCEFVYGYTRYWMDKHNIWGNIMRVRLYLMRGKRYGSDIKTVTANQI